MRLRAAAPSAGRHMSLPAVVVLLGAATAGCGGPSAECVGVRDAGIILAVTDRDSGEAICDAVVHIESANHAADLIAESPDPCRYIGAPVPGTYTIEVTREGYVSTTTTVEVVAGSGCSAVEPEEYELRLVPQA